MLDVVNQNTSSVPTSGLEPILLQDMTPKTVMLFAMPAIMGIDSTAGSTTNKENTETLKSNN